MPMIAMIDPGAGAGGGLLVLSLVVVFPISISLHLYSRRFFVVCASVTCGFTLLLLALWMYLDAGVPERGSASFRLVWLGFLLSLAMSILAGVIVWLVRAAEDRARRGSNTAQHCRAHDDK